MYASLQSRGLYKRQYFPMSLWRAISRRPTELGRSGKLYHLDVEPIDPEITSTLWADAFTGISRANFAIERWAQ